MTNFSAEPAIEWLQKKAKFRIMLIGILGGVSFIILLVLFISSQLAASNGNKIVIVTKAIFVSIVALGIWLPILYYALGHKAYKAFNTAFKNRYVLETITEANLFDNLSYNMHGGFSYDNIRNSAVVHCGDQSYFLSEDMLAGSYKNVAFHFSDVTTRQRVSSGRRSRIEDIFAGQVLRFSSFDPAKESDSFLQIFQKEFLSNIKGWTAKNKMETDNQAFNSKFQIYADNPHNTFYILTPQFIEDIMAFSTEIKAQIALSFCGPVMHLAVNRNISMFDGSVFKPLADQKADIINDMRILQKAGDIFLRKHDAELQQQSLATQQ